MYASAHATGVVAAFAASNANGAHCARTMRRGAAHCCETWEKPACDKGLSRITPEDFLFSSRLLLRCHKSLRDDLACAVHTLLRGQRFSQQIAVETAVGPFTRSNSSESGGPIRAGASVLKRGRSPADGRRRACACSRRAARRGTRQGLDLVPPALGA